MTIIYLLGQDVDPLTKEGGQDEPEGVHGGEGLGLLLLPDLGLGPDGPHGVAGAGEDRLVERVGPGKTERLVRIFRRRDDQNQRLKGLRRSECECQVCPIDILETNLVSPEITLILLITQ